MKILILVNSFPPEIRSASHLFYELAESLVKKGYKVTVLTGLPRYNVFNLEEKYKRKLFLREDMNGIEVVRIAVPPLPRRFILARAVEHFLFTLVFSIEGVFLKKKDIVLVYSPPLPLGLSASLIKFFRKTPFIFNVQDLYPQAVIDLGLLRNSFLINLARTLEKFIYKKADLITVHSQGNLDFLVSNGVKPNKISVVPNCVDTGLIKPENRINDFRQRYNLGNSFVVSYAGVMGFAQDLETVVESAKLLDSYKDIIFLLVGEGVAKEKLQNKAKELQLKNVKFLQMQPRRIYPQVLAASDICLTTLTKEVKTPVVPGKIMSIMAAGRPIIASLPLEGDASKIIKQAQAGIVVEPENPEAMSKAILELYKNKEKREICSKNARKYAEQNFSRNTCVQKYEDLFLEIIKK